MFVSLEYLEKSGFPNLLATTFSISDVIRTSAISSDNNEKIRLFSKEIWKVLFFHLHFPLEKAIVD